MCVSCSLSLYFHLPSLLLEVEDDKLCRLQRSNANPDVDDAEVDGFLDCGLAVIPDKASLMKGHALIRSLAEEVVHECAHVQVSLSP